MGSSVNRKLLACLLAALAALPAAAATDCRISSGTSMAFGPYDVMSPTPNDSLATVTAVCTRNGGPQNVTITLQLSPGSNGGSVTARRMAGSTGDRLAYNLFRDVSRSAVWGFSTGVDTLSQTLSIPNKESSTATFTIYGRIPASQDVAAGSYADAVTVTIAP